VSDLEPTLAVLLYSSFAALAAALGVLPQAIRGRPSLPVLGWGNALASGLMLGVAFALLTEGLDDGILYGGAGAVLGLIFVRLVHRATGTRDLNLNDLDDLDPAYGYRVVVVNTLHAGYEGVAIGVAMWVSLPFGISMALALAVHNIPEAMALTAIVAERGVGLGHAALLAVATNLNQVLLGILSFTVLSLYPALLPWSAGFAVGAVTYLVLVELLPESYRQAGHTSIAVVTLVALGMVVALAGGAP